MAENGTNSYEPNRPTPTNRRFYLNKLPTNPWTPYVGDCKGLDTFLASKNGLGWIFPKFLNAFFRGIGQVVFCNNPLTGLIILLSLFWADSVVGLATTLAASTAILTAIIFRQEVSSISAGLTTYNAVLVGSVTASLWTPLFGQELTFTLWAFIILGSVLSVFVNGACSNLLGSFRLPLPSLTFPFNIVTLLLFTCLMPRPFLIPPTANTTLSNDTRIGGVAMELVQKLPEPLNNSLILNREVRGAEDSGELPLADIPTDEEIAKIAVKDKNSLHWGSVLQGILLSFGQVYGVNNLPASILMMCSTLFYSPTIFFLSFMGATLGSIFGIVFAVAPYDAIYDGLYGFNGILSAAAVGGFFYVLTLHSFGTAMVNVIFTVLIQQALSVAFGPVHLPVFTLPFVLSTFLFLQMTATGDNLSRVTSITFPEMHRYYYKERLAANSPAPQRDTTDEIAEEKQLVNLKEVKVIMEETPKEKEEEVKE